MNSPTRGLCVRDFGSVFAEVIFFFHCPVRSGLHMGSKSQLGPASFHGSLPIHQVTSISPPASQRRLLLLQTWTCQCLLPMQLLCGMKLFLCSVPHLLKVLPQPSNQRVVVGSTDSLHFLIRGLLLRRCPSRLALLLSFNLYLFRIPWVFWM